MAHNTKLFILTPTNNFKVTQRDSNNPDGHFLNEEINITETFTTSNLRTFINKDYNFSVLNLSI